ncbi:uncharacterized protein ACA1_381560 [Acanthamoeba castellanii str. Neff]|uniref:Uncharacterized protein n=1 Tax=Acanthamoeba castellanii (strain ATCC 30010 / Neff) TaxID=1257118 RepID=L8GNP2_ACACF|nr:uncharacterized protein ACA1_381560 [Acanthamoeba castellanii str. Neff]ELR14439.1 hypothetical protein ACA1_381560 [Acanthamoeba castellanii str. Neff]
MTLFEPFLEMQRREEHLIQQREKYLIFETQRLELRKQLTQLQLRLGPHYNTNINSISANTSDGWLQRTGSEQSPQ